MERLRNLRVKVIDIPRPLTASKAVNKIAEITFLSMFSVASGLYMAAGEPSAALIMAALPLMIAEEQLRVADQLDRLIYRNTP